MNPVVTEIMSQFTLDNFETLSADLRPHKYLESRLWEVDYCPYTGFDTGSTITKISKAIRKFSDINGVKVIPIPHVNEAHLLPNPEMVNMAFFSRSDRLLSIPFYGKQTPYTAFTMLHEFAHATIIEDQNNYRPQFIGQYGDGLYDPYYVNEEILAEQTAVEVCDALNLFPNIGRETLWRSAEYLWHFHHYYERSLHHMEKQIKVMPLYDVIYGRIDFNSRVARLERMIIDRKNDFDFLHEHRLEQAKNTIIKYLKEV